MTTLATNNQMLTDEEFETLRNEAYAQNPSSVRVDLEEAYEWCRTNVGVGERNCCTVMAAAKKEGRTLVEPRAGVANMEAQDHLLKTLEEAGADILPVTVDSMTRTQRFDAAAKATRESTPERSMLNGYPVIHHGTHASREMVMKRKLPESLESMKEVPTPIDIATGKPFVYQVEGDSATLSAPVPPGAPDHPSYAIRFVLKLAR